MNLFAANDQPTLEDFGHDVWWIVLIKIVGVFALLVFMTLFAIVFERKVVARMQQRIGPNCSMKCSFTIIIVSAETTSLS